MRYDGILCGVLPWNAFQSYILRSLPPPSGHLRYCKPLTTNSSLSEDLELLLTHCVEVLACALLSSALILSSVTSSTFSALMNTCASWNMESGDTQSWQKVRIYPTLHFVLQPHANSHTRSLQKSMLQHTQSLWWFSLGLTCSYANLEHLCKCFSYKDCKRTKVLAWVWGQECTGLDSYR